MSAVVTVLLAACTGGPAGPPPGVWTDGEKAALERMRLAPLPADPTNRWADDPGAAAFGQALFFDPALSASGAFACANCHIPDKGFADDRLRSQAAGTPRRHTPPIPGAQAGPFFGWAGDSDSLWAQALGPMLHPAEMAATEEHLASVVTTRYAAPYEAVFGAPPASEAPTRVAVNVAKAIAAYERRLVPEPSRFDRYLDGLAAGAPGDSLDDLELRGLSLFLREGCVDCHHGPMLTDGSFHTLGIEEISGYDKGRTEGAQLVLANRFNCRSAHSDTDRCDELDYLNPAFADFEGAFKTPTLRNVARTAPYFHSGAAATLEDVIEFYDDLPGDAVFGHRELTLRELALRDGELEALVAFLRTLDAMVPADLRVPPPRPADPT
ncbi:MAG: hypothetical protein H6737_04720 [Alphaproteobacteria bacterium]|nr:hypothetical protein [Alphaproteobacteria bacterium]